MSNYLKKPLTILWTLLFISNAFSEELPIDNFVPFQEVSAAVSSKIYHYKYKAEKEESDIVSIYKDSTECYKSASDISQISECATIDYFGILVSKINFNKKVENHIRKYFYSQTFEQRLTNKLEQIYAKTQIPYAFSLVYGMIYQSFRCSDLKIQ